MNDNDVVCKANGFNRWLNTNFKMLLNMEKLDKRNDGLCKYTIIKFVIYTVCVCVYMYIYIYIYTCTSKNKKPKCIL